MTPENKQTLSSLKANFIKDAKQSIKSTKVGNDLYIDIKFLYFVVDHYMKALQVLKDLILTTDDK